MLAVPAIMFIVGMRVMDKNLYPSIIQPLLQRQDFTSHTAESIFVCLSSVYPMTCQLHEMGCTKDRQANMLSTIGFSHETL